MRLYEDDMSSGEEESLYNDNKSINNEVEDEFYIYDLPDFNGN